MPLLRRIGGLLYDFDIRSTGKWFLLSGLIGIVAGLGAIIFELLTQLVVRFTLVEFAEYIPGEAEGAYHFFPHEATAELSGWLIVVVMALGGLASGFLVYTWAPEAEGHGTDAAIDAFHNRRGFIRARIPFVKTIASAITIGTGGSGGREGPIAQIGAGFGSYLASRLHLPARDRRIMLAAGVGAGIGAIFRAPLAGALFAAEILYKEDLESDVIVPAAMSSIIGYSVYSMVLPSELRFGPLFRHDEAIRGTLTMSSALELVPYTVLALILVIVAVPYIKVFYGTHSVMKKLPIRPHFRPALGAALAGLLGVGLFAFFENAHMLAVLSTGYGALQTALNRPADMGIQLLLAVALGKILTTSLTIGSGGSGGVFGPSMVIGGCLGAAVGQYFHTLWPELVTQPQTYAIVGMAGFFAGAAHAPLSTIIMVSELTGDYRLLLPSMWVSTLCFVFMQRWTLYHRQVPTRLESPAHRGDFIVDVLEGLKVKDVPYREDVMLIPEGMTLDEIVHILAETQQHYFPVVDKRNRMVGIFSSDDVRAYLYDETLWDLAVARDIMVGNFLSVSPHDDLNTALKRFTSLNLDELPIIDPREPRKLLGMLRRKETIAAYNRRMMEHKQEMFEGSITGGSEAAGPSQEEQPVRHR